MLCSDFGCDCIHNLSPSILESDVNIIIIMHAQNATNNKHVPKQYIA